jgi:flagellar hook-associated protein 3 FlgL
MRISTSMMMENYANSLNSKYDMINKYSNQIDTTMKFERASDDPVAAMQTLKHCHDYAVNQQYQETRSETEDWMNTTESTLNQISTILSSAQSKATETVNGTNNPTDLKNEAVAFTNYRDELVSTLNTSFGGQYVFGKSTSDKPPFKLSTADDVTSGIATSADQLMYYNYNASTPNYTPVSSMTSTDVNDMKLSNPVDLGMGLSFAADGSVNKSSVFESATSGLAVLFSGTSTGSNNIVDNLTRAIGALNTGDAAGYSDLLTNVGLAQDAVLKVKVDVGERSSMLVQIDQRLTDDEENITSGLATSMEVDSVKAIQNFNIASTVYKETMSISSTVLQNSLIDFLK